MPSSPLEKHNPYAASSKLGSGNVSIGESATPKRPISVWLMQVFMFMFVGLFGISAIRMLLDLVNAHQNYEEVWKILLALALDIALIFSFVATAIALYRRATWSKWVSLLLLFLLIAFIMLRPDTSYYVNNAERAGALLGRFFVSPLLMLWWGYALAFSKKGKAYFASHSKD
ncbi:hypothetical protein H8K35_13745 [Undibacterium sp. LX40W]|uniref:Uncharacterized protein n=1 Tax=Undibacterium nitidum TaxID=2762298 RepID=A0A923HN58_9BURK|nr:MULTISPECIES: hypothetical protein [Undibacterium]MBC3882454.1 hypothetical protein [Undibacterium nitidum]MBC3892735.1 hypothetical protein [Undibacterium sp. LX40W]